MTKSELIWGCIATLAISAAVLMPTADFMSAYDEQIAVAADDCDRAEGIWLDATAECVFPQDQPRRVAQNNDWSKE